MLIEDYNHRDEPVEHHGVPTADRDICGASGLVLELNASSSRLLSLSDEEVPFVDRNFTEKWNYQKVKYESDKTEIYQEILEKIKVYKREELSEQGFEDELWNHFNRLPIRRETDVNIEGPEDVLRHMMLLQRPYDSATKSAFEVRMVQANWLMTSITMEDDVNYHGG
ncbi:hypothetical protein Vadar_031053 [Vaccinium darrowii]|uniref:Uncharacterized protein n=1 Tax=Vaccinium darrowii TaxID=229202 RepID=A0ACB7X566_9ERIC|nr:hypothetical protein Vadar_031053 [Vaccinium darrowii]